MLLAPLCLPAAPAAPTANVAVKDLKFVDQASGSSRTTISAGTTVVWSWPATNNLAHSASQTFGGPSGVLTAGFESGIRPAHTASSYSFTFAAPGVYQYACRLHSSMTGTIVVTA